MIVQSWTDVIVGSLQNLWMGFANFVPNLIAALVVLIIGLIVAAGLGALVEKIFEAIRLDTFLDKLGVRPYFERAGMKLRAAYFLGRLVYWFVVIAFLLAASDSLGLYALSAFLTSVLNYLPNVIAAELHAAHFLGSLTWWAIVVFGLLAALTQLNIAAEIIQSIVTGFIAMLALAGGLAFGLGGRDYAAHLVGKLKDRTEAH